MKGKKVFIKDYKKWRRKKKRICRKEIRERQRFSRGLSQERFNQSQKLFLSRCRYTSSLSHAFCDTRRIWHFLFIMHVALKTMR